MVFTESMKIVLRKKLSRFQNSADGIEELSGFKDFPETIIEKGSNEGPDLIFNDRAVQHTKTIRKRVLTVGT